MDAPPGRRFPFSFTDIALIPYKYRLFQKNYDATSDHRNIRNMNYIPALLIAVWLIGLIVLLWRWMENIRIVHNNLAPGAAASGYMKPGLIPILWFRFSAIDPEHLNSIGRSHLNGAIWTERVMYVWMTAGLFLAAYYSDALRI